jgi:hypothetical protein
VKYSGAIESRKGVFYLVRDACRSIPQSLQRVVTVEVVGDGSEFIRLENRTFQNQESITDALGELTGYPAYRINYLRLVTGGGLSSSVSCSSAGLRTRAVSCRVSPVNAGVSVRSRFDSPSNTFVCFYDVGPGVDGEFRVETFAFCETDGQPRAYKQWCEVGAMSPSVIPPTETCASIAGP